MRFYKYLILFLLFAFVAGCTHEEDHPGGGHAGFGDTVELTITVNVPGIKPSTYALDDPNDEKKLEYIDILVFDVNATTEAETFTYATHGAKNPDGTFKANVKRSDQKQRFVFFANLKDEISALGLNDPNKNYVGKSKEEVLEDITFTSPINVSGTGDNQRTALPMWRETGIFENGVDGQTNITINLVRSVARIDVGLGFNKADDILDDNITGKDKDGKDIDFVLKEVTVYNAYTTGLGAALDMPADGKATDTSLPETLATANKAYTVNDENTQSGSEKLGLIREIYVSEFDNNTAGITPDKMLCLVVKGRYKTDTKDTYYRIDFLVKPDDVSKGRYNILRNHCYRVNITSVGGSGYPDPQTAFDSRPVNMTNSVVVWNEPVITGVVTDGQYKLGVSQSQFTFTREARGTDSKDNTLTVSTDHPKGWTAKFSDKEDPTATSTQVVDWLSFNDTRTRLILTANDKSSSRIAYIHLTAGRLIYTVKVTQNALSAKPEIGITDKDENEISVLEFGVSQNGTAIEQLFNLHWSSPELIYTFLDDHMKNIFNIENNLVPTITIGHNDRNGTINAVYAGKYKVIPNKVLAKSTDADPFPQDESILTFTASNGVSTVSKALTLRHFRYNITYKNTKLSSYSANGNEYGFTIYCNTGWEITNVDESGGSLLEADQTHIKKGKTGGYNTAGDIIKFKTKKASTGNSTVKITFKNITDGHFDEPFIVEFKLITEHYPKKHGGWAGTNIYYDNTKGHLTFDATTLNEKYEGVLFRWGSLWGISPKAAWSGNVILFPPSGGNGIAQSYKFSSYSNIPYAGTTNIVDNENRAYLYEITDGIAGKGDICKYLTEQGYAPKGKKWRMPTIAEFGKISDYTRSSTVTDVGINSSSEHGVGVVSYGTTLNAANKRFFPSHSHRGPNGDLSPIYNLQHYASSSASEKTGYTFWMGITDEGTFVGKGLTSNRGSAVPVRCVVDTD